MNAEWETIEHVYVYVHECSMQHIWHQTLNNLKTKFESMQSISLDHENDLTTLLIFPDPLSMAITSPLCTFSPHLFDLSTNPLEFHLIFQALQSKLLSEKHSSSSCYPTLHWYVNLGSDTPGNRAEVKDCRRCIQPRLHGSNWPHCQLPGIQDNSFQGFWDYMCYFGSQACHLNLV